MNRCTMSNYRVVVVALVVVVDAVAVVELAAVVVCMEARVQEEVPDIHATDQVVSTVRPPTLPC